MNSPEDNSLNMMTPEQRKIVTKAYTHLLESEKRGWDNLDDYIDHLEYLDDEQLCRESEVVYEQHKSGSVKCQQDHPKENCFIPVLVDASSAIIDLYNETKSLHVKNRYVLQYYLAMNQADMIVVENAQ